MVVDTTQLSAAGFEYRYTSAGAVQSFIRAVRLRRGAGRSSESYTYEHDVEQFFRHSPSVLRTPDGVEPALLPAEPGPQELSSPLLPLLGGHGEAGVVLPHAVDLEEPLGHPLHP